jgi:uncharacterized protein YjbJ (UPF0337 family)
MNRHDIKGRWKQLKGHVRQQWGDLTDDDIDQIAGRRQVLVGKIQERYGRDLDTAEREIDEWLDRLEDAATAR